VISAFDNGFLDGILIVNALLDSPKVVNIKVNYETANIFAQPICRLFFLYTYLVFHSLVHPSRSSRYVSVNEITVGVASTLGPILGGLLAGLSSAGTTFFAAALLLLLMSLFCARVFQLGHGKIK
jgi:predicted MFS family arabinose efflux permease